MSGITFKNMENETVDRYRIGTIFGYKDYGAVYKGYDKSNNEEVAVKVEPISSPYPELPFESRFIREFLTGSIGFPQLYYFEKSEEYHIEVISLLGRSLADLHTNCMKKFSLKTTLLLAIRMIEIIEKFHNTSFVHRGIKW